jgi:hypothetical protein
METGIGEIDDGTRSAAMVEGCAEMLLSPASKQSACLPAYLKVETPIHDNVRESVTWECKEHGVKP